MLCFNILINNENVLYGVLFGFISNVLVCYYYYLQRVLCALFGSVIYAGYSLAVNLLLIFNCATEWC